MPDRLAPAALLTAALFFFAGCGGTPKTTYPVLQEKGGLIRVDVSGMESSSCRFFSNFLFFVHFINTSVNSLLINFTVIFPLSFCGLGSTF